MAGCTEVTSRVAAEVGQASTTLTEVAGVYLAFITVHTSAAWDRRIHSTPRLHPSRRSML